MTPVKLYIWLTLTALLCCSCTNNDDTPRHWFGSWSQTAMSIDGEAATGFEPNTTIWEFQNDVIRISMLGSHNTMARACYGTWRETDGHLLLDFTHSDNSTASGTGSYAAPDWLLMPAGQVIDLEIIADRGRQMQLQHHTAGGATIVYMIKKTW